MSGLRATAAWLLAGVALACALPCAAQSPATQAGVAPATPSPASHAVVIYRCTDANGHVTLQNDVACPKGARQQRQVVDVPPAVPAYAPQEDAPAPAPAPAADERAAAPPADPPPSLARAAAGGGTGAGRLVPAPPPALYACRTWDERELLTEDAAPAERCAPLRVVDAGGAVRDDAAACEKVRDQCEAVPPDALCEAWRRRVDEAEFRWKFAGAHEGDARHREFEALAATLARSDCGSR